MHWTAKKCTKEHDALAELLFSLLPNIKVTYSFSAAVI